MCLKCNESLAATSRSSGQAVSTFGQFPHSARNHSSSHPAATTMRTPLCASKANSFLPVRTHFFLSWEATEAFVCFNLCLARIQCGMETGELEGCYTCLIVVTGPHAALLPMRIATGFKRRVQYENCESRDRDCHLCECWWWSGVSDSQLGEVSVFMEQNNNYGVWLNYPRHRLHKPECQQSRV